MLERMPLHSRATSILKRGRRNTKLSRRTGSGVSPNNSADISAEHFWRKYTTVLSRASGSGMKKNRNIIGNRAARIASLPNASAKPAMHSSTKPNAHNDGDTGWVRILQKTAAMPGINSARQTAASVEGCLKIRRRWMNINQADINGIRRMWDASSFPNEYQRRAAKAVQETAMLQANHPANSSQRRFR